VGCDMYCSKTRKTLRTALFWMISQRVVVISDRCLGAETSVRKYHYLVRNKPEQRSSCLQRYVLEEERIEVRWEEEIPWRRLEVDGRMVFGGGAIDLLQIRKWKAIARQKVVEHQYSKTNMLHILFSFLRIKGLYMFRALLSHLQEVLHKRHLVYCLRVMSVGCTRVGVEP
jgi:hypothetical protein